jgi:hypothetical protein
VHSMTWVCWALCLLTEPAAWGFGGGGSRVCEITAHYSRAATEVCGMFWVLQSNLVRCLRSVLLLLRAGCRD